MLKWLVNHVVKGYVKATKFITTGGTSSDFVKGDGSLDGQYYLAPEDSKYKVIDLGNFGAYDYSVLPLCKLSGVSDWANRHTTGHIHYKRNNLLRNQFGIIELSFDKYYQDDINPRWAMRILGGSPNIFKAVTFTLNGETYGGLRVGGYAANITEAKFIGVSTEYDVLENIPYFDFQGDGTILNQEINDSIQDLDLSNNYGSKFFGGVESDSIITALGGNSNEWNESYDTSLTALQPNDLDGYATESWVNNQGFLTEETDSQTLSWSGSTGALSISNGNSVDLDGRYLQSSDISGLVPYTGANQDINFNTQKITYNGIVNNGSSITSPWISHTSLRSSNKVAYLIIDGFTANSHRQLYIEVESVAGNGEYKRVVKGFNFSFTSSNNLGSVSSRYIEVTGYSAARYGIGEVEKHSDTALKIPLIWITSTAQSINKISVKARTGSVSDLTFNIEYDATSTLTTENPYLYRNANEDWVNNQGFLTSETDPTVPSHVKAITTGDISNWDGKENAFTKNTAFNKNFGTTSGTVVEGDDSRLHTHSNKSVLDGISVSNVNNWDSAFDKKVTGITVTGTENKVITITREDGTTITANLTDISYPNLPDDVINTLTFTSSTGELKAITSEGISISASIDGRYSLIGHSHTISDINNLQNSLDSKEPKFTKNSAFNKNFGTSSGTVAEGNDSRINNGQTAYGWGNHGNAGYALASRTISAGTGLTGGGSLAGNRTISLNSTSQTYLSRGNTAYNSIISSISTKFNGELDIYRPNSSNYTRKIKSIKVLDTRNAWDNTDGSASFMPKPNDSNLDRSLTGTFSFDWGGTSYGSVLTLKGWAGSYSAWQISGSASTSPKNDFYLRAGSGDTWDSWNRIWHSGDFDIADYATESWVNNQNYLTSTDLNGYATETYVDTSIADLVDSSPSTLDTLNELAAALGDDPNFATTVSNQIGLKADKSTSILSGTGLNGGGNLSLDRTLSVKFGTASGTVARGNDSRFHSHSNKSVLDGISSSDVSSWDDKQDKLLSGSVRLLNYGTDTTDRIWSANDLAIWGSNSFIQRSMLNSLATEDYVDQQEINVVSSPASTVNIDIRKYKSSVINVTNDFTINLTNLPDSRKSIVHNITLNYQGTSRNIQFPSGTSTNLFGDVLGADPTKTYLVTIEAINVSNNSPPIMIYNIAVSEAV